MAKKTILVVSDLQIPFEHKDSFKFLKACKKKYSPNEVVNIGDEVDFHALSDYEHDPDGYSAGDELRESIRRLHKLYKIFPKCKVCISNHTSRPFRRAYKFGIPKQFIKDYHDFLEAPKGWEWREHWEIDGIRFMHGDLNNLKQQKGRNAAIAYNQSCVIGHWHTISSVDYVANKDKLMFGMVVGSLIDADQYAFAYQRRSVIKPILSVGLIENGIPRIIPMLLDKNGDWSGTLP